MTEEQKITSFLQQLYTMMPTVGGWFKLGRLPEKLP